ncbi:MAG: glycosyltransferase family 4 protein [Solirubrobacterales bacterium]|nr:glycosyltransferase family 4 protein [Solirubrobacterales bacterium]
MPVLRRLTGRNRPAPVAVELPAGLLEVMRDGPAPLTGLGPQRARADRLRVAVLVPSFRRGSGGHQTIATLVRGLEARGHRLAVFVVDQQGRHRQDDVPALFQEFFGPVAGPVLDGLDAWRGADLAVATGWQTVPEVLRLPDVAARAYLVQDHEPEFYATSAERMWAEWTYRQGLHCICASPWLAEVVTDRYGASATPFDLGVDHDVYKPLGTVRRDELVLFYARAVTPRRAVPLGVLALAELHRRRPGVEIAVFGEAGDLELPFPARQLGVVASDELAHVYAHATVGLCLSLTNPSLIPTEMLACGLPVVDVASDAMVATFGAGGPVTLTEPEPLALANAVEGLLDDLVVRAERSRDGVELVAGRTWEAAAGQVEAGLRAAMLGQGCPGH